MPEPASTGFSQTVLSRAENATTDRAVGEQSISAATNRRQWENIDRYIPQSAFSGSLSQVISRTRRFLKTYQCSVLN